MGKFRDHPWLPGLELEPPFKEKTTTQDKWEALRPKPLPLSRWKRFTNYLRDLDLEKDIARDVIKATLYGILTLIAGALGLLAYDPFGWRNHGVVQEDKKPTMLVQQPWDAVTKTTDDAAK